MSVFAGRMPTRNVNVVSGVMVSFEPAMWSMFGTPRSWAVWAVRMPTSEETGPVTATAPSCSTNRRKMESASAGSLPVSELTTRSSRPMTPPSSLISLTAKSRPALWALPQGVNGPESGSIAPMVIGPDIGVGLLVAVPPPPSPPSPPSPPPVQPASAPNVTAAPVDRTKLRLLMRDIMAHLTWNLVKPIDGRDIWRFGANR